MKASTFKKFMKEAVREVFQEEIREILLETVKQSNQPLNESINPNLGVNLHSTPPTADARNKYADILGETALSFTTKDVAPLNVTPGMNTMTDGSSLPAGEVSLDAINGIMTTNRV